MWLFSVIHQVQLWFLNRILGIRANTANAFCLLETGQTPLFCVLFKRFINFVDKIYRLHDQRFAKLCLMYRLDDVQYFFPNIVDLTRRCGSMISGEGFFHVLFFSDLPLVQTLLEQNCQEMWGFVSRSSYTRFKYIKVDCNTERYLNSNCRWWRKRIMFWARTGTLPINAVSWKEKHDCDFCDAPKQNDIHIVFFCPFFTRWRNRLAFGHKSTQACEKIWQQWLCSFSSMGFFIRLLQEFVNCKKELR